MKRLLFAAWLVSSLTITSKSFAIDDKGALEASIKKAKVTLAEGLSSSKAKGTPLSGKFELEDGKLQLSVYTAEGGTFSEVIVDHKTGKVEKTEAITKTEDLTAAKAQNEAMQKAKHTLADAVSRSLKQNAGYHAVSVAAGMKDAHPVAEIALRKGQETKSVTEKLD